MFSYFLESNLFHIQDLYQKLKMDLISQDFIYNPKETLHNTQEWKKDIFQEILNNVPHFVIVIDTFVNFCFFLTQTASSLYFIIEF